MAGPDFQEALRQFRADFARQVPLRLQEAQGFLQACLAQPQDETALRELHRVLHKLAGSAGTFGLGELGDAARAIEEQLEPLLANPARTAADFTAIRPQLEALVARANPV